MRKTLGLLTLLILAVLILTARVSKAQGTGPGHFTGRLVLVPSADGRTMIVQEPYAYTDWDDHTLEANPGFVTDGATIPRVAWSVVGGPWDGKYRNAAVVHDVGCDTHKYTWQITARLFYEAMLDSDVSKSLALTMYYAVLAGGPRWEVVSTTAASTKAKIEGKIQKIIDAREAEDKQISAKEAQQGKDAKAAKAPEGQPSRYPDAPFPDKYESKVITPGTDNAAPAGRSSGYYAMIYQIHRPYVSEDSIRRVQREIEAADAAGKPMSPEDIEKMATQIPN